VESLVEFTFGHIPKPLVQAVISEQSKTILINLYNGKIDKIDFLKRNAQKLSELINTEDNSVLEGTDDIIERSSTFYTTEEIEEFTEGSKNNSNYSESSNTYFSINSEEIPEKKQKIKKAKSYKKEEMSQQQEVLEGFLSKLLKREAENFEEYEEDVDFGKVVDGSLSGSREPKDMPKIFGYYDSCFKAGENKQFTPEFNKGLYEIFVLGAKEQKRKMKEGTRKKKIKFQDGSIAFWVLIGKPNEGVRSEVDKDKKYLTYPDFCACITLYAFLNGQVIKKENDDAKKWYSLASDYPRAPLAANIYAQVGVAAREGWHVFGHSGLPAVANFINNVQDADNYKFKLKLQHLVTMAFLMDKQAKGDLAGQFNTLESIARTCRINTKDVLDKVTSVKWSVETQNSAARRNAVDLKNGLEKALRGMIETKVKTKSSSSNNKNSESVSDAEDYD